MAVSLVAAALLAFGALIQTPAPPAAQAPPRTTATTPSACIAEVRDYTQKRQQDVPAMPTVAPGQTPTPEQLQLARQRSAMLQQINQSSSMMAKECLARFDVKTTADKDLVALVDLAGLAGAPEVQSAAVGRALLLTAASPEDRAQILVQAVSTGIREQRVQKSDDRMPRLESYADELDKSPAATIDQKIGTHSSLLGWYRYDDVDGGIVKHSTWLIDAGKTLNADQRKKWASAIVAAYVDMAQAWAGQGMNDRALDLLRRAPKEWPESPNAAANVESEINRYSLVGTPAAPLVAPRWLNMPAGKTELSMPGAVTLLEFSAHWCIPCKESYPGVNRLRAKYGPQGFRFVLATQLYGYFEKERPLDAATEIARDRTYFAEHGMDVPIAIGDPPPPATMVDGKRVFHPEPNSDHYRVGGIPQIMLIDRKGVIRLIMVGYDDANEAKLAKMIEGLLAEK
jgi:hypothetical protein